MNARETITAAIEQLKMIRSTPSTAWTYGPFAKATTIMRCTVEPQIAILRQALEDLEPTPSGLRLPDDAVQRELDLATAILEAAS